MSNQSPTISFFIDTWLSTRKESKSYHTYEASRSAAKAFLGAIGDIPLPALTEDHFSRFLSALKIYQPKTEQLYATLIYGWFEYLGAKDIKSINLPKLNYAREHEQRKPGKRLRKFDHAALDKLKDMVVDVQVGKDLPLARAKALVIMALESGLRVSELCKLLVGDLDFENCMGIVIGKGDKERRFPFTKKSVGAIQEYLSLRRRLEADRGKELEPSEVPIFVSHSKRGHSKLKPMDTDTAGMDLKKVIMMLAIIPNSPITMHLLRHFAGNEFRKATGDMELVRILLGHESGDTTQGYMHAEDEEAIEAYHKIFSR